MTDNTLTKTDLAQFTGSEEFHYIWVVPELRYTDGVQYVARQADAYWLIADLLLVIKNEPTVANVTYQVWTLKVRKDKSAVLTCDDGNENIVYTKEYFMTDFPLDEITFWFIGGVLMLPSEY